MSYSCLIRVCKRDNRECSGDGDRAMQTEDSSPIGQYSRSTWTAASRALRDSVWLLEALPLLLLSPAPPWSPSTHQTFQQIDYWKLWWVDDQQRKTDDRSSNDRVQRKQRKGPSKGVCASAKARHGYDHTRECESFAQLFTKASTCSYKSQSNACAADIQKWASLRAGWAVASDVQRARLFNRAERSKMIAQPAFHQLCCTTAADHPPCDTRVNIARDLVVMQSSAFKWQVTLVWNQHFQRFGWFNIVRLSQGTQQGESTWGLNEVSQQHCGHSMRRLIGIINH